MRPLAPRSEANGSIRGFVDLARSAKRLFSSRDEFRQFSGTIDSALNHLTADVGTLSMRVTRGWLIADTNACDVPVTEVLYLPLISLLWLSCDLAFVVIIETIGNSGGKSGGGGSSARVVEYRDSFWCRSGIILIDFFTIFPVQVRPSVMPARIPKADFWRLSTFESYWFGDEFAFILLLAWRVGSRIKARTCFDPCVVWNGRTDWKPETPLVLFVAHFLTLLSSSICTRTRSCPPPLARL